MSKITALETERASLGTERAELRAEVERLKDDLEALAEERHSHEANISSLNEKINLLTIDKEKVGKVKYGEWKSQKIKDVREDC